MDSLGPPSPPQCLEQVLCRAVIAAHLITGDLECAEEAVLRGIGQWNPDGEPKDQLVLKIIENATRMHTWTEPNESTVNGSYLKDELKAVLRLEPRRRASFVLRNLVGLSSQLGARLLGLRQDQIDEYNLLALCELAPLSPALEMELRKPERPPQHS